MASLPGHVRHQQPRFEKKVGIVGVGRMGSNMAERLYHSHVPISVVFDPRQGAARDVAREFRCTHAQTLAEVTASCEIVLSCVSDDAAVEAIFAERGDSLLIGARGITYIEATTCSPKVHVDAAKRVMERGGRFIEAGISGSAAQAKDGTLYMLLGGDKFLVDNFAGLLRLISRTQVYVGEVGRAAQVGALINMVTNMNIAALAEGLALGDVLGINLDQLREIFSRTGAGSRILLSDGEEMQRREHTTHFSAEHASKDMAIAAALGQDQGLDLPLTDATRDQFRMMVDAGLGHIDVSGLSELTFAERRKKWKEIAETARANAALAATVAPARKP